MKPAKKKQVEEALERARSLTFDAERVFSSIAVDSGLALGLIDASKSAEEATRLVLKTRHEIVEAICLLEEQGVPNLDDETREDLEEKEHAFSKLHSYAIKKGRAMELREQGKIEAASRFEAQCDAIYESLPDWAKW